MGDALHELGALYDEHAPRIYRYLYHRLGDKNLAEDLTGEVFVRFLHARPAAASPTAYLYRIAHNLVANWHRDHSRRKVVPLEDVNLSPPPREGPQHLAEQKEEENELLAAVRRLPADRQQLLILKFVEEMSNTQIGLVMGRSEGAIKSLYHRTLLSLREMLEAADAP